MLLRMISTLPISSLLLLVFTFGVIESRAVFPNRAPRLIREVYPEDGVLKQSGSQVQVCIVGDIVYGAGENVVSSDPCQQCQCHPPGVECEPILCPPPNPGCRALHRPDQCCPQYQCECKIGNRTYGNGERLEETSSSPCEVCYCRGGVVRCSTVGCYKRDDCKPVHVPGQCCPKYDNCPPRVVSDYISSSTESSYSETDSPTAWTLSTLTYNYSYSEEDSKEIDSIQSSGDSSSEINTVTTDNIKIENPNDSKETSSEYEIKVVPEESRPKITIKEVLPEVPQFPLVSPPKREISHETNLNKNGDVETSSIDPETSSSESTKAPTSKPDESYQRPPPVIKVGDQLIFLHQENGSLEGLNTPSSIITIFGAEGLQRGVEESDELATESNKSTESSSDSSSTTENTFKSSTLSSSSTEEFRENTIAESSATESSSTEMFREDSNLTTDGPTRIPLSISFLNDLTEPEPKFEEVNDTELFSNFSSTEININGTTQAETEESISLLSSTRSTTETYEEKIDENPHQASIPLEVDFILGRVADENSDNVPEHNPAYPPLPEDLLEPSNAYLDIAGRPESGFVSTATNEINHHDFVNPLINEKAALPLEIINLKTSSDLAAEELDRLEAFTQDSMTTQADVKITVFDKNISESSMEISTEWIRENSTIDEDDSVVPIINDSSEEVTAGTVKIETIPKKEVNDTTPRHKSVESTENMNDSGESVTEANKLTSVMSNEDASVQNSNFELSYTSDDVEVFIKTTPKYDDNNAREESSNEYKSAEKSLQDVEVFSINETQSTKPADQVEVTIKPIETKPNDDLPIETSQPRVSKIREAILYDSDELSESSVFKDYFQHQYRA